MHGDRYSGRSVAILGGAAFLESNVRVPVPRPELASPLPTPEQDSDAHHEGFRGLLARSDLVVDAWGSRSTTWACAARHPHNPHVHVIRALIPEKRVAAQGRRPHSTSSPSRCSMCRSCVTRTRPCGRLAGGLGAKRNSYDSRYPSQNNWRQRCCNQRGPLGIAVGAPILPAGSCPHARDLHKVRAHRARKEAKVIRAPCVGPLPVYVPQRAKTSAVCRGHCAVIG